MSPERWYAAGRSLARSYRDDCRCEGCEAQRARAARAYADVARLTTEPPPPAVDDRA